MIDIKSMTLEELTAWLKDQGEPAFRARQVFKWLYRGVTSFEEMTDLSKALRQKLEEASLLEGAAMVENCGMEGERVFPRFADAPADSGYFSVVVVKRNGN